MIPADSTPPSPPSDQLLAAAQATVAWVRARQASWDAELALLEAATQPQDTPVQPQQVEVRPPEPPARPRRDSAGPGADAATTAAPPPPEVEPVPVVPTALPVEASEPSLETSESSLLSPALSAPSTLVRAGELAHRILPTAGRALAFVTLLALVVVAGVQGRNYLQRRAALAKVGTAVLESVPAGSEVVVDGQSLGETPLTTALSAGTHTVELRYGNRTHVTQLVVPGGGRVENLFDWTRKPMGTLRVTTAQPGARVLVDGVFRGVTPLLVPLVTGTHSVAVANNEGTVQQPVTVSENHTTNIDESIFPGWVKVFAPFDVTATEGGRPLVLDDTDQVMLPAGPHDIQFANAHLGYQVVQHVDVQPGGQTIVSLLPPPSSLTVDASAPAQVWIDGSPAGQTPLVDHPIDLGIRNIVVKTATGQERQFTVTVTVKPVVLTVDFSKPSAGQ